MKMNMSRDTLFYIAMGMSITSIVGTVLIHYAVIAPWWGLVCLGLAMIGLYLGIRVSH